LLFPGDTGGHGRPSVAEHLDRVGVPAALELHPDPVFGPGQVEPHGGAGVAVLDHPLDPWRRQPGLHDDHP
jgi:hypothetical protein